MPERNRPPTDEIRTEIYDPLAARAPASEHEETTEKTEPPEHLIRATRVAARSEPMRAQTPPHGEPMRGRTPPHGEPIRVFSLKTPAEIAEEKKKSARIVKPKIRSLGEISGTHTPPGGMGFLAPPRDANAARTRHNRSNTRWALVALAIALVVGVGMWLVSAR